MDLSEHVPLSLSVQMSLIETNILLLEGLKISGFDVITIVHEMGFTWVYKNWSLDIQESHTNEST